MYKKVRSKTKSSKKKWSNAKRFPWRTTAIAQRTKIPVGFGTSCRTVLRTSFFYTATGTAATGIWTGFLKPGSAFDPTGDLATIQPKDFDQYAAIYSRYQIQKCKVVMKVHGMGSAQNTPPAANGCIWVAAAYPATDPTALTTYQAAASQQYAKTQSGGFQIIRAQQGGNVGGAGNEGKYIIFNLNHNAVIGSKADTYDNGAVVTADPTAGQYMVMPILLQASGTGNDAPTWLLEIDMYQTVLFSAKKNTVDA